MVMLPLVFRRSCRLFGEALWAPGLALSDHPRSLASVANFVFGYKQLDTTTAVDFPTDVNTHDSQTAVRTLQERVHV